MISVTAKIFYKELEGFDLRKSSGLCCRLRTSPDGKTSADTWLIPPQIIAKGNVIDRPGSFFHTKKGSSKMYHHSTVNAYQKYSFAQIRTRSNFVCLYLIGKNSSVKKVEGQKCFSDKILVTHPKYCHFCPIFAWYLYWNFWQIFVRQKFRLLVKISSILSNEVL